MCYGRGPEMEEALADCMWEASFQSLSVWAILFVGMLSYFAGRYRDRHPIGLTLQVGGRPYGGKDPAQMPSKYKGHDDTISLEQLGNAASTFVHV
jgi:hypothetical protein